MSGVCFAVAPGAAPATNIQVVGVFVGLVLAFLLKPVWVMGLAVRLLAVGFFLFKWLMVIGLVAGFTCLPQVYCVVGWTPTSILFGDQIYAQALRTQNFGCQLPTRRDTKASR